MAQFLTAPAESPELLQAQYAALSRHMPIMYFILISSSWAVVATHLPYSPPIITLSLPILLTLLAVVRTIYWWTVRDAEPSVGLALRAVKRVNRLAVALSLGFAVWSFLLFPYGDAYTRSHLVFYMALTAIACAFCLMYLRTAAVAVTVVVNGALVIFLAATGQATFVAIAINIFLVSSGILAIISANYSGFTRLVNTQRLARGKDEEQNRLLRMIDDMPVAVMTVEPGTLNINYANETSKSLIRKIEHLLPIKASDLLGTSIDVFHANPAYQRRILSDPKYLPHNARIKLGPEVLDLKVSAVMSSDGKYIAPMLTWALVTKEVEAEDRIRQLAHYDQLTGLPNRHTFHEKLKEILSTRGNRVGLLFIDLDGFKLVNDTRGHHVGDILLRQAADRLRDVCNAPATIVGRLGGDEFVVLVPHNDADEATRQAVRIVERLSTPYMLDHDRSAHIGASVGIALAPDHAEDGVTLLARADIALYEAKAAGKGIVRVFQPEMEIRIQERIRLQEKLRGALDSHEGLFVFYQPIVDIRTNRITGREALVRWHHPKRGWISPGEFVPVAEQSGLIDKLGDFVLNSACDEATHWPDGARVAVNVSANQLGKGTLPRLVSAALRRSGLTPAQLEIEVTETALLDDERDAISDLGELRAMGVRVALDDFGTGYSSLAHLRVFPFDKIKIDGSFVRDAVERPDCAAVVRAIADLGHRLNVTTVAEGVETQAHLDRVKEEGCTEVQGYFFSRPMPNDRDAAIVAALSAVKSAQ